MTVSTALAAPSGSVCYSNEKQQWIAPVGRERSREVMTENETMECSVGMCDHTEDWHAADGSGCTLCACPDSDEPHNSASEVDRLRQRVEKLEQQNERLADDANRELSLWNDERKRADRLEAKRAEDGRWIRAATSDAVAQRIRAERLAAALRECKPYLPIKLQDFADKALAQEGGES